MRAECTSAIRAPVAAALLSNDHHLDQAAGHAGEIGGGEIHPPDLSEIPDAGDPRGRDEEGEADHGRQPAEEARSDIGRKGRPEHHADHRGHGWTYHRRCSDRQLHQRRQRADGHRAEHPRQGQHQPGEEPSPGNAQNQCRREFRIRKPAWPHLGETTAEIPPQIHHAGRLPFSIRRIRRGMVTPCNPQALRNSPGVAGFRPDRVQGTNRGGDDCGIVGRPRTVGKREIVLEAHPAMPSQ